MQYFNSININNVIYSIDKLRFTFVMPEFRQKFFIEYLKLNYDYNDFFSNKFFAYKFLFKFFKIGFESQIITMGFGFNGTKKEEQINCFIEFNPNKVGNSVILKDIYKFFRIWNIDLKLSLYDIAVDFLIPKKYINLVKDRRVYKKFYYDSNNENVTEYLGSTVESGRVKLYNKTIEDNLNYDLTRCELTTNSLDFEIVSRIFPKLYILNDLNLIDFIKLSKTDLVLLELIQRSDEPSYYFKRLGKDKKKFLEPYLNSNYNFNFSIVAFNFLFENVIKIFTIKDI